MNYDNLKISNQQAEDILFKLFQIKGKATALPGELDFNFRIKVDNNPGYILKISRPNENENYLDFQQQLLQFVADHGQNFMAPKVISDTNGNAISKITDDFGKERHVRLLSWVSGRVWSGVNPQLDDLRYSLGKQCGLLTQALQGFDHAEAHRAFDWDVAQSLWTKAHVDLFRDEEKAIGEYFQNLFENSQDTYSKLRKAVVHNDANDNNIIVTSDLIEPKVEAVIDYGDAVHTQIINDVAVACAYAIMDHNDPLEAALPIVQGYHSTFELQEDELAHLYNAIAMRLVISVTKSAINKIAEPDNTYLLISEKPAWEVLEKWRNISSDFAHFSFRDACGYEAHPKSKSFKDWAEKQSFELNHLFPTIDKNDVHHVDLSVSSKWIGHQEEFNDLDLFQFKIDRLQKKNSNKIIAGGYLEPRALYTSDAYDKIGNSGKESRTIHLGVDF